MVSIKIANMKMTNLNSLIDKKLIKLKIINKINISIIDKYINNNNDIAVKILFNVLFKEFLQNFFLLLRNLLIFF